MRLSFPPPPAPGSVADKLKAALDKPVKLAEAKSVGVKAGYEAVLKAAGLEIHLRVPTREEPALRKEPTTFSLPAGEYPLGTWFELIADGYSQSIVEDFPNIPKRF